MPTVFDTKSIYYDDINLIAQPQFAINSRSGVPKELWRIIASPMQAVVGHAFALEAARLGLAVCLHRFDSVEKQLQILKALRKEGLADQAWVSVGLDDYERIKTLGHNKTLIDIANGYLSRAVEFAKELRRKGYSVMAGNVHSATGLNLYSFGCHIRVGIGNGSVCKTGEVSGYTRGQVTEILECYERREDSSVQIIADGGIKGSGEAAKAFGLGADFVMIGGLFSRALEAENVINGEMSYWGGASAEQLKKSGREVRHVEGRSVNIDAAELKPLSKIVDELWDGISSAVSYSGHSTLNDFVGNGVFEIKQR